MQQETQGLYVGVGIQVLQRGADVVIANVFPGSPGTAGGARQGRRDHRRRRSLDGRGDARHASPTRSGGRRAPRSRSPSGRPRARAATAHMTAERAQAAAGDRRACAPSAARRSASSRLLEFDQGAARRRAGRGGHAGRPGARPAWCSTCAATPGGWSTRRWASWASSCPRGRRWSRRSACTIPRQTLRTTRDAESPRCRWSCWWTATAPAPARSSPAPCVTTAGRSSSARDLRQGGRPADRELPNRGALHFTIARYLTPKGVDLNHKGLTPDIVVATSPSAHGGSGARAGGPAAASRPLMARGGPAPRSSSRSSAPAGARSRSPRLRRAKTSGCLRRRLVARGSATSRGWWCAGARRASSTYSGARVRPGPAMPGSCGRKGHGMGAPRAVEREVAEMREGDPLADPGGGI